MYLLYKRPHSVSVNERATITKIKIVRGVVNATKIICSFLPVLSTVGVIFGKCERMVCFIHIYLKTCDRSVISQYCKSIIKDYLERKIRECDK